MSKYYEDRKVIQRFYNFDEIKKTVNDFTKQYDIMCTKVVESSRGIQVHLEFGDEGEPDEWYDDDIPGFTQFLGEFGKELGCDIMVPWHYYSK